MSALFFLYPEAFLTPLTLRSCFSCVSKGVDSCDLESSFETPFSTAPQDEGRGAGDIGGAR